MKHFCKFTIIFVLLFVTCNFFVGCGDKNNGNYDTYLNLQGLDFYLLDNDTYGVKIGNATELSCITIPEKYCEKPVTLIMENGFKPEQIQGTDWPYKFTKIVIPKTIEKIEKNAFLSCLNLTTVEFADDSQLTTIDDYAFYDCEKLRFITLPQSLTNIGSYSFYLTGWTHILIPENVQIIGEKAFGGKRTMYQYSYDTILCKSYSSSDGWNNQWYVGKEPYYYRSTSDIVNENNYDGKFWVYENRNDNLINTWSYDTVTNAWKVKEIFKLENDCKYYTQW